MTATESNELLKCPVYFGDVGKQPVHNKTRRVGDDRSNHPNSRQTAQFQRVLKMAAVGGLSATLRILADLGGHVILGRLQPRSDPAQVTRHFGEYQTAATVAAW